jgi:membrane associated rhomboid family serine protease
MLAVIPLELRLRIPLGGIPWANWLLVILNVGFFFLDWTLGWQWTCGRGSSLASVLLYGFSHAGFWHLAVNMWA